jgi:hypothetical protein
MKATFHHFETAIPEGWIDASVLSFLIPPDAALTEARAALKNPPRPAGNVSLTWGRVAPNTDLLPFLQGQAAKMAPQRKGFMIGDQGKTEDGIAYVEVSFEDPEPVRQMLMVRQMDQEIVLVTGTALSVRFNQLRPSFLEVARKVQKRT